MSLLRATRSKDWHGVSIWIVVRAGRWEITVGPVPSLVWAVIVCAHVAILGSFAALLWRHWV
jgi:hypothetical protein